MLQITDEIWQEQIRDGKLTLLYLATEKVLALLQNSQKCDVLHFFLHWNGEPAVCTS